jgi:Tol biopolymer transport system component
VPGTTRASAVNASPDGSTIYYTFPGDSIVYARDLAGGAVTVVHNFGTGHIVRDPSVVGARLVAVVDGQPGYLLLPPFNMVQVDYGGRLVVVDLLTGSETWLPDYGLMYKRPVLSPDGSRFVTEGFPFTAIGVPPDTVISKWADLYLFEE